jgi:hypothetical protein
MMDSVAQYNGFKNRLINGAMVVSQRNAAASVTPAAAGQYLVDRWVYYASQTSKFTAQQNAGSVTPPAGFTNYLGFTSSSAYSVTGNDYFLFQQVIEGLNFADLAWGTASAATVTLSFWVRSSLTGTFGGALRNYGGTGRSYPFTYTISSSNTWEQKTITVAGSTDGTWNTTNTGALQLTFSLGASGTELGTAGAWSSTVYSGATGQTNVVGTNGATFYITGVQLEKGVTATSFDYRPYTTELQLCQRYYYRVTAYYLGYNYTGQVCYNGSVTPKVVMRTTPTLDASGNSFPTIGGTVALLGVSTADNIGVYNSANNWGAAGSAITVTAGFGAEL